jgi:hypothetical protein
VQQDSCLPSGIFHNYQNPVGTHGLCILLNQELPSADVHNKMGCQESFLPRETIAEVLLLQNLIQGLLGGEGVV